MSKNNIDETTVNGTADNDKNSEAPARKQRNLKKLKYGSMFYITICLVTAIVVVLNLFVGMAAKRSPMKIDITPDNRYELSSVSVDAVKALDKDVEITVTTPRDYFEMLGNYWESYYASMGISIDIPFEMIPQILDKYSYYAEQSKGSIKVKYVDMDKDPDLVNKYKEHYNGEIQRGSIIVASGDRVKVISGEDIMNMLQADSSTMSFNFTGESTITSAVNNVTDNHPVKVAFVRTVNSFPLYDEQYSEIANTLRNEVLAKNGYDCTDIDIIKDELDPAEYDLAVVFAPSADFTENVINKLSDFLKNNGEFGRNMLYVPDDTQTELHNIEEFLADWSIKVENSYIADDTNAIVYNTNVLLNVGDQEAVGTLPNDKLPIVAPYIRELTILTKNNRDIVKEVLKSYDTSYTVGMTDKNNTVGDTGAKTAAILTQKKAVEQLKVSTSSLLVFGSPSMFDGEAIQQNNTYNNANVILNTLNTMTGKASGVVVPDKNLQQTFLSVTTKQANNVRIIVVWVIPFIAAAVGIIVLLRRRNK